MHWRGVLANGSRMLRWMITLILSVTCAACAFTQLGFISMTLPGGETGYLVVLLLPVALGALLLGTGSGVLIGLIAGVVLLIHAKTIPLDHYELTFVTPITSIVMFGLTSLLIGVFFAFALRNDPRRDKRIVYIVIVCLLVSWLYSVGFLINVIVALVVSMLEFVDADVSGRVVQQIASATALRLGDMGVQAWGTGLLMTVFCVVGDQVAYQERQRHGAFGLRAVFGVRLCVVVALSFLVMAAVSFAVSTADALRDAEDDMHDEVVYISRQMAAANKRTDVLEEILEQGKLDWDGVDSDLPAKYAELIEDRTILEGYTPEEDGIVIVTVGDIVDASDDERFALGTHLDEVFAPDALEAIEKSIETGEMQRFVFDDPAAILAAAQFKTGKELTGESPMKPRIAYVYAERVYDMPIVMRGGEEGEWEVRITMIRDSSQVFAKRPSVMTWMSVSAFVLLFAVFGIVFQLLDRVVARRIDETNEVLARVTAGNLDAHVEVCDTREFESLSTGINTTVDALKGWIAEAETRMDAELATARTIQETALPLTFPPYPDISKFDIYATMNAAKQVGGDFYDFFLIGDNCGPDSGKLGFVMADVSGKGVPAALFMMKAKTQIHDYMGSGMALGEAIENVNRQLCDGNGEGMFVTAWVGVLDYETGRIDYVNAGHNPPLLWQRESGWVWLKERSGLPLGLFDGLPYKTYSLECTIGDQLLLYTDGVTEAMDVNGKLYGEERLEQLAKDKFDLHPRRLVNTVRRDVAAHAEGAEQSDDITILALEVGVPPEVTATLIVPANVSELPRVNDFIHTELDRRLCPVRAQNQLDIAVEELFVNVCRYAYPDATPENPGVVRVSYTYSADPPSVQVDISDEGIPYDPLAKPDAVTPDDIMQVPIGGLGILMAKRSVDDMKYKREDSSNVVSIVKKW